MADEKKEGDLETRIKGLEKGLKTVAYTVRRMKNWLEAAHGADIDGDGQIGKMSVGKGKSVAGLVLALSLSCVLSSFGASAYIFNLNPGGVMYPFSFGTNGIAYLENVTVSNAMTVTGNLNVGGALTTAVLTVTSGSTLPAHDIAVGELPAMTAGQAIVGTANSNAVVRTLSGVTINTNGLCAVDASVLTAGTVASAIDLSAGTNINGAAIASGNIGVARITNALVDAIGPDEMEDADHGDVSWATSVATVDNVAGGNISGNIAVARITNALATAGPSVGGNIPIAALTNAMPTMAAYAVNDLGNGTNIAAGNIASGDIASDRMTANGVVVTDFTQNGGILVGTGAGTFAEETGATLRASIDCPANSEVFGSCSLTNGALASGQLISTNTITLKDIAGNTKSGYALIRVWTSESAAYGPASTNNIEALTLSDGTAVATVTANADYWYVSKSDGTAIATITHTACQTNYLNVSVGENVTAHSIPLVP